MSRNIKLVIGITLVSLISLTQSSDAQRFRVQPQSSCTCQSQTQYYGATQQPVYNQYQTPQYQVRQYQAPRYQIRQYVAPQMQQYYVPQQQYATPQYAAPQYATPLNQVVGQPVQNQTATGSVITYPNATILTAIQGAPTLAAPATQATAIAPVAGTYEFPSPATGTNTSAIVPAPVQSPTPAPVPTGDTAITPHAEPPVADQPATKLPTESQPKTEKSILSDK